ncbi:MAG TPA: UDP-N-acetylmuramoyl-L-alanyl-D-glutamate--2,6-diaminopimelate ligase [Acidimicrobiales bacterium]|nr:UDP-N-acetylmuramoyl-L-alanyl-D-glutamate--2,6-diaminopimelate ligase [Acidimicrobiales bacterium]
MQSLLEGVEVLRLRGDPARTEITSITQDSRTVTPGALFCCLPGSQADGHDFASRAVTAGASALLCERELPLDVSQAVVRDARAAAGPVAAAFYGNPSRQLAVVGVTGTNGKTTTTHLVKAVLEADGRKTGVIGTLSGPRTTPEAIDLQARLAEMVAGGSSAAAIEVSSHALVQHRVSGTWFSVVAFTNLSPEHLDYHKTMDAYFEAKLALFNPERAGLAVVNADDPWGRRLIEAAPMPITPFSLADVSDIVLGPVSSTFVWDGHRVELQLGGSFNVANAVAAAAIGRALGVDSKAIAAGLSTAPPVPGRVETVGAGQPFLVIVDYAHTPASLEQVLLSARGAGKRVITVFGCGGDRDRTKRPAMGEVATRLSDVAILTSDNPRSEDPSAIIGEVRAGIGRSEVLVVEPDRRAAIANALAQARAGDVVVLAGKGHETVQLVGERSFPFDDRQVAREVLAELKERAAW